MTDWNEAFDLEMRVQEIISIQQDNGFAFDREAAELLINEIGERQDYIYNILRPFLSYSVILPYKMKAIDEPFKKNGDYKVLVSNWMGDDAELVGGPFTRVEFAEPNLGSDKQRIKQLLLLGWKPTQWNFKKDKQGKFLKDAKTKKSIKTSPKLTEDSYSSLKSGHGLLIAEYLVLNHRKSLVEGFLDKLRPDGCLTGKATVIGTPTFRMRHAIVANIPKAKDEVLLGKRIRALFIARKGRKLVGHDAAGLEARCEAHNTYPIDKDYAINLIEGDAHSRNAEEWGVIRDVAKNGKYALGYGAYPPRLAATLHIPLKKAKHIFDTFWSDDNPLYVLKRRLEWENNKNGYIVGLDGRRVIVRKQSDLINYKFQSDGAIIMKRSLVILDSLAKRFNIDYLKVVDMHDEGQNDVRIDQVNLFGTLAVRSIRMAGLFYNLNVPLDADYSVGDNWAETH